MASVNKVFILGTLGADPEPRQTSSGVLLNFNLASNRVYKDANGERKQDTEWHKCVAFSKSAENISKYSKKGDQIWVEGRLRTRNFLKDGATIYVTEIYVENFQLLPKQNHQQSQQNQQQTPRNTDDDMPF